MSSTTPPSQLPAQKSENTYSSLTDAFSSEALVAWVPVQKLTESKLIRVALIFLICVVGVGGIWASTAPIGGAVVASGTVVAEGRNRVIQHLEGGILSEIYVREGDRIETGMTLATLDDTQASLQLESMRIQQAIVRIQMARRNAEAQERDVYALPDDIGRGTLEHPRVQETIASQREEFIAARRLLVTELEIADDMVAAAKEQEMAALEVVAAFREQQTLLEKEIKDLAPLVAKELIRRSEFFARERALADVKGEVARARQQVAAARNEQLRLANERKQTRLEYLRQANAQLVELQQRLNETEQRVDRLADVVRRSIITSPVDGTVFQISKQTLGAVLQPGESLMSIFPEGDALTVEAQIEPQNREQVWVGQAVELIFPSDKKNGMLPVKGVVRYLSADAVQREDYPIGLYVARIEINEDQDHEFALLPGNLAEVYLKTEPKTFFGYVVEPIAKFAFRAFKG